MDPRFILGHPMFDNNNRKLFRLLSDIEEKVGLNTLSVEDMSMLRSSIMQFAMDQFGAEEQVMHEFKYPNSEEHATRHAEFLKRILILFEDVAGLDDRRKAFDVVIALTSWFAKHVLKEDASVVQFLNQLESWKSG